MNDHQVMYFVGAKDHPAYNFQNVTEFAGWIKKGLPKTAPVGPLVWLRPANKPTPMNSHYFGFKEGIIMATTLEFPFAPPGKATDPASCRKYGQVILQAWVNTHFVSSDQKPSAEAENPAVPKNKEISVAKVADNFEWVPAEALGGVDQTESGAEQIIPKITITKTPKPTADPAKYTREYVIEREKFHISNTGIGPPIPLKASTP